MTAHDPAEHVLHQRPGLRGRAAHGIGPVLGHELRRVEALRHDHDDGLDGETLLERERPLRGARAGLIGVEREHGALGEPREELEVLLTERRSTGRHRVLDPCLDQPDDVGVALHHERLAAARDRRSRAMQVVEDSCLR